MICSAHAARPPCAARRVFAPPVAMIWRSRPGRPEQAAAPQRVSAQGSEEDAARTLATGVTTPERDHAGGALDGWRYPALSHWTGRAAPSAAPPTTMCVINHPAVSGITSVFRCPPEGMTVTDLNSTNGTQLNGQRMPARRSSAGALWRHPAHRRPDRQLGQPGLESAAGEAPRALSLRKARPGPTRPISSSGATRRPTCPSITPPSLTITPRSSKQNGGLLRQRPGQHQRHLRQRPAHHPGAGSKAATRSRSGRSAWSMMPSSKAWRLPCAWAIASMPSTWGVK